MGVIIGGTLGHAICTGIAVLGGRIVAQKISVRTGEHLVYINLQRLLSFAPKLFVAMYIKKN